MAQKVVIRPQPGPQTCGIYAIICLRDGKRYIGSSKQIEWRCLSHREDLSKSCHVNPYLQNAWDKYGEDCFEFVVVEECEQKILLNREQFYLDSEWENGLFNIARRADRPPKIDQRGLVRTEESRQKNRLGHLGKRHSLETRAKISLLNTQSGKRPPSALGRKRSEETKQKMSSARLGKSYEEQYGEEKARSLREGISRAHRGTRHTLETRQRMRESQQRRRRLERGET